MVPRVIGGPCGCLAAMGSERLQGFPNTATHQGWLVRIDMLTQRAGQVVGMPEPRRWFVPGRRCCGYWNYLATVGAVDCDVPLVGLNAVVHQQDSSPEPKLSEHSDPLGDNQNSEHCNDQKHRYAFGHGIACQGDTHLPSPIRRGTELSMLRVDNNSVLTLRTFISTSVPDDTLLDADYPHCRAALRTRPFGGL